MKAKEYLLKEDFGHMYHNVIDQNIIADLMEEYADLKAKEAYDAAKYDTVPQMTYEQWRKKQQ